MFNRALFTLKNYFLPSGQNLNICSGNLALRDKEENWRRVLRDKERLAAFRQLVGLIRQGKEKEGLLGIINDYKENSWKKYFIKSPEPFRYCKTYLIRASEDKEQILLFNTLRLYGNHAELRTYSFYCDHIRNKIANFWPFRKEAYYYNPRNNSQPCFLLDDLIYRKQRYSLEVYYDYEKKIFELNMVPPNGKAIPPAMSSLLTGLGFSIIDDWYVANVAQDRALLAKLKEVSEALKAL